MTLYRLTQKKFSDTPFSPAGAKLYGGRWNSKGTEALYCQHQLKTDPLLHQFQRLKSDPPFYSGIEPERFLSFNR